MPPAAALEQRFRVTGWVLGLLCLGTVVALWVLSSFLVNQLFENDLYSKPFFITYINTSMFIFYLTPLVFRILRRKIAGVSVNLQAFIDEQNGSDNSHSVADLEDQGETTGLIPSSSGPSSGHSSTHSNEGQHNPAIPKSSSGATTFSSNEKSLSLEETIKLSFQFCILWYLANLVTNACLKYTSVSSQTILSSTSSFFTLFLGYLFRIDRVNRLKIVSLVLSMVGIIIITKVDANPSPASLLEDAGNPVNHDRASITQQHSPTEVFFGNFLALFGAFFYGAYTVLLKLKVRHESRLNTKLFFGFVGIFNLVLLYPTLILWDRLGIETLELPSTAFVWKCILVNCLITFISDYCWAIAVLLTSPLTVTVGLSFAIPLAMLGDAIFKQKTMPFGYLVGAVIIGVSFFFINRDEEQEEIASLEEE